MVALSYYCEKCRTEHARPGRCKTCGGEFIKWCNGCANPPQECTCDTKAKCSE